MSTVTVTCVVELSSTIIESDIPLLMVDAQLSRDGTMLSLTGPAVTSTTFIFTRRFETFRRSDSGNYTCIATVRPQPTSVYLTGSGILDNTVNIAICKYTYWLNSVAFRLLCIHAGVVVRVHFESILNEGSTDINFSLSCNSTGGPADSVVWIRDGFLLHNTDPLVMTDAATLSYTNVLMVSGRIPGTYTCQIRGPNDHLLNSANFSVQGKIILKLSLLASIL